MHWIYHGSIPALKAGMSQNTADISNVPLSRCKKKYFHFLPCVYMAKIIGGLVRTQYVCTLHTYMHAYTQTMCEVAHGISRALPCAP